MIHLSPKMGFLSLIFLGVALEVAGDILFRKWALENKTLFLGIGLLIYFIGSVFWALSLK